MTATDNETTTVPPRLRARYREEILPALHEQFGYANVMQVPGLTKIVVNMGVGEAARDSKPIDGAVTANVGSADATAAAAAPQDAALQQVMDADATATTDQVSSISQGEVVPAPAETGSGRAARSSNSTSGWPERRASSPASADSPLSRSRCPPTSPGWRSCRRGWSPPSPTCGVTT